MELEKPRQVLVIPTSNVKTVNRCLRSFHDSLEHTNTLSIIVYNGNDSNVETRVFSDHSLIIGMEDSERLANTFANLVDVDTDLIFGKQYYKRSYGGASNLLLAIVTALKPEIVMKVDDDCVDTRGPDDPWLENAIAITKQSNSVSFGLETGISSQLFHKLPNPLQTEIRNVLFFPKLDGPIKNGILAFKGHIASIASYPVLFEPVSRTKLRGEVFLWRNNLFKDGVEVLHNPKLHLGHYPIQDPDLTKWLKALLIGYDFWSIVTAQWQRKEPPALSVRKATLKNIKAWLENLHLPIPVDKMALLKLLDPDLLIPFSDNKLSESLLRDAAWKRLMNLDLSSIVRGVSPLIGNIE